MDSVDDPGWSGDGSYPGAQWACLETKRTEVEKKHKAIDLWDFKNNSYAQDLFEKYICASTTSTKSVKVTQGTSHTKDKSKCLKAAVVECCSIDG